MRSPYYKFFDDIIQLASQSDAQDKGVNEFYIPDYLDYLLTYHLPYLPMMNGTFVQDYVDPATHLLTNNYVESWFNEMRGDETRILLKLIDNLPHPSVSTACVILS